MGYATGSAIELKLTFGLVFKVDCIDSDPCVNPAIVFGSKG